MSYIWETNSIISVKITFIPRFLWPLGNGERLPFPWQLIQVGNINLFRGVTGIFVRGQSHFSWFFSRREMFFLENPILVDPKQISLVLKSEKKKKKKKKKGPQLFLQLFLLPFTIFHFPFFDFPFFLLHFPYFACLSFPDTSAEVSGGHSAPCPPPPPVTPLITFKCDCIMISCKSIWYNKNSFNS